MPGSKCKPKNANARYTPRDLYLVYALGEILPVTLLQRDHFTHVHDIKFPMFYLFDFAQLVFHIYFGFSLSTA